MCAGPDCPQAALGKRKASPLTPENATSTFWQAQGRGLPLYEAACSSFIGRHSSKVAQACPQGGILGPLLAQVAAREAAVAEREAAAARAAAEHRDYKQVVQQTAGQMEQYISQLSAIVSELPRKGKAEDIGYTCQGLRHHLTQIMNPLAMRIERLKA